MSSALRRRTGTATSVRRCGGMPAARSSPGRGLGATERVISVLTIAVARSAASQSPMIPRTSRATRSGPAVAISASGGAKIAHRHRRNRRQIAAQAPSPDLPKQRQPHGRTEADRGLEVAAPLADQPVSRDPAGAPRRPSRPGPERASVTSPSVRGASLGKDLDFGPVAVARRKIHRGIGRDCPADAHRPG